MMHAPMLALRVELRDGIFRLEPEADVTAYEGLMLGVFMTVITNTASTIMDRTDFVDHYGLARHFKRELFN